jgi:hypothetical protein
MARDATYLAAAVKARLLAPFEDFSGPSWKWALYFYVSPDGSAPARTFLDELPDVVAAAYAVKFTRRCRGEQMRWEQHHRWEDEEIYHYKDNSSQSRLFTITQPGFVEVLLFGYVGKKENRMEREHTERAKRLRDDYMRRKAVIDKKGALKP